MSAREQIERALARAGERRELGAFWALDHARARAAADAVDRLPASFDLALRAVPVAVKDLFDQAGLPTTVGLAGEHPPAERDSAAVRRLRRSGAVPIGKTAMDQLGASTGGQAPGFRPCRNPIDARLSPGGSSSGSAVAVAAGVVPMALGSDTAGSVRIPAAYCGIVGLRPPLGAVPRRGCTKVMPGFDTPGVLGRSVDDCVRALGVLAPRAPTGTQAATLRVALLADLAEASEPSVAEACARAGAVLSRSPGVEVSEARLDWRAEGFGAALAFELAETWGGRIDADPSRFSELVRSTVAFGRRCGRTEHDRVIAGLAVARRSLAARFASLGAVLCPTVPTPAPDVAEETVAVSTRFTRLFNALNWPAISVPAGRDADGRPIGVQLAAPPPRLASVLELARRLEGEAAAEAGSR